MASSTCAHARLYADSKPPYSPPGKFSMMKLVIFGASTPVKACISALSCKYPLPHNTIHLSSYDIFMIVGDFRWASVVIKCKT